MKHPFMSINGFVLAREASRRMGRDKAKLLLGQETLLGGRSCLLRSVCRSVRVVGPAENFEGLDAQVFPDGIPGRRPLGGIYTGLLHARTDFNLSVGCDMPFMEARILRYLCGRAFQGEADVTVPDTQERKLQPLSAVYRRRALGAIRASLAAGENKVSRFYSQVRCLVIPWHEIARTGFTSRIFDNIHTCSDYDAAKRLMERKPEVRSLKSEGSSPSQGQNAKPGQTIAHEPKRDSHDRPYIEFVRVYKAFDEQPVLVDVSFEVCHGEMVVVLGRSGVGKSVTLKHILGFLQPDEGQVFVRGQEVSKMSEGELTDIRRRVTMVFQSGALFDSLTVGENVAYPLRERAERGLPLDEEAIQARVEELLALVELEGARDVMPSDLSTGMKRAVAIARALAAEPEAILYDEPTTMVDPLMAQMIGDLILKLKRQTGLTSVVVTHDMKLARKLADRVVFLIDGRVAYFGPMSQLDESAEPIIQDFIQLDEVSFVKSS